MQTARACIKLFLFMFACLLVIPFQLLIMLFHNGKYAYTLPFLWQNAVRRIFRIKVSITGTPAHGKQLIYMSNHVSYLDIPVIGSVLPASFVAKKDVASWPVFGFLSRLQQTAFISRSREDAKKEKNALDNMIKAQKSLIIFPEGTSTDGKEVLPFKSSLFAIALPPDSQPIDIQPITLKITSVNDLEPNNQDIRDLYAWHNNMDTPLDEHLWRFAKSKGAHIRLHFHEVIESKHFSNRKTLAHECFSKVSNELNKN